MGGRYVVGVDVVGGCVMGGRGVLLPCVLRQHVTIDSSRDRAGALLDDLCVCRVAIFERSDSIR